MRQLNFSLWGQKNDKFRAVVREFVRSSSGRVYQKQFRQTNPRKSGFMTGRPTRKKPPTQIKTQFAQTISEQFVQTVPPFPFKMSRKQAKRVCANCLCKLFLFGWVVFWGGSPSLESWRTFGEGVQELGSRTPFLRIFSALTRTGPFANRVPGSSPTVREPHFFARFARATLRIF